MAERRQIDINLLLKGVEKLDKLTSGMEQGEKSTAAWKRNLRDVRKLVEDIERSTSNFNKVMRGVFNDRKNAPNIVSVEREMKSGGTEARLRNAAARGQIAQFEATANQLFARLTNTYTQGFRKFVKAVENQAILELSQVRQLTASSDRRTLDNQIAAQQYRVAEASRDRRLNNNLPAVRDKAHRELAEERRALEQLEASRRQAIEAERALKREQQAQVNLTDRIRRMQDPILAGLQKELEIRRMIRQMDLAKDSQYRTVNDSLARTRKIVGLERQIDDQSNTDIQHLQRRLRTERQLEEIDRRRAANLANMRTISGDDARMDRLKLRIKNQVLEVERARLRSNGQITHEVTRQEARLRSLVQLKQRIAADTAKQRLDEIAISNEVRNRKIAQNRANAADPEFIRSQVGVSNAVNRERLMGDGGAFLFGIQAQLLGNYLVMNKLFDLFHFGTQFVLQLDQAFHQLQAITATTSTEMEGLSEKLVDVSALTKFTAVEVAQAAVTLGQAGFSTSQIKDSIESVTLLATAVGTDLGQAVDLATSTLSVFNLQASEMASVANIITGAVNESKLTIDKLALGIQYAGNIAAEQGVTLTEFTSVLGAMANSGIRAGSTLGTGLRQLLITFAAPTAQMVAKLRDLGLSMEDINVRTQGLAGVFRNLQQAGFTSADAMQVLEVRAGAAFAAVANNIDAVDDLQAAFLLSNAAVEANVIQMESLSNKAAQAASVLGSFIMELGQPLLKLFKQMVDGFSAMVQGLSRFTTVLQIAGTVLGALGLNLLINRLARLGAGLLFGQNALIGFGRASTAANASVGLLNKTLAVSRTMLATFWPAAILMAGTALISFFGTTEDGVERLDRLNAKVDETGGRVDKTAESINSINGEIRRLIDRSHSLEGNQSALARTALELTDRFGGLGAEFDANNGKVSDFIDTLNKLRQTMLEVKSIDLQESINARNFVIDEALKQARDVRLPGVTTGTPEWQLRNKYKQFSFLPENLFGSVRKLGEAVESEKGAYGTPLDQRPGYREMIESVQSLRTLKNDVERLMDEILRGVGAYGNMTEGQRENLVKDIRANYIVPANQKLGLYQAVASNQIKQNQEAEQLSTSAFDLDPVVFARSQELQRYQAELDALRIEFGKADTPETMQAIIDRASTLMETVRQIDKFGETWAEGFDGANYTTSNLNRLADELNGTFVKFIDDVDERRIEVLKVRDKFQLQRLDREMARLKKSVRDPEPIFPDVDPTIRSAIHSASRQTGVDFGYLMTQANRESSFNPLAKNPGSTATGLFQFIESTWLEVMKKFGSKYGYSGSDAELLKLRTDPKAASLMAAEYASQNASYLKGSVGRAPTSPDLYLAHFLGAGGAEKFLKALSSTPRVTGAGILPKAAASNRNVFYDGNGRARSVAEIYDSIIEQFTFDNSPSRIQETKEKFLDRFDEQTEILTRQLTDQLRQEHTLNTPVGKDALADLATARREEREKAEREFDSLMYSFDKAGQNVVDSLDKFAQRVSEVMKDLSLAKEANRAPMRRTELQLEAMDLPGLHNRYSDVQRRALRETLPELETAALQADLGSLEQARSRLESLLTGLQEERDRFEKVKELAENTVQNYESRSDLSITAEAYHAAAERAATAQSTLNKARDEGIKITNQLKEVDAALAETLERVEARTGRTIQKTYDLNKALTQAYRQWAQDQGLLKDETARVADGMRGMFDEVSGSLKEFSKTALIHTNQIGDAFVAMAARIAEAMLDIAMQETASGLFGMVKGLLPSLGGGSALGPTVPGASAYNIPGGGMAAGGFVRAAAGRHITTRDSVPALLMDGEYVLRRSAVDMIGRESLDQINALGNRAISNGPPQITQQPDGDKTVNVYVMSPEQKPVPGKNDVILWIGEDMANGGQTKKLVKSINMGVL